MAMAQKRNSQKRMVDPDNATKGRIAGKALRAFLSMGLLLLVFFETSRAAQIPCVWTGVRKIIAVGDLHGDYDNFILILKNPKVGLVDDDLHWIGGKTHFVQTGDIMDRGDKAKDIFDFLMRLEKEAEAAGGKVHVLLGNHEEATITGISLGYPDYVSVRQFVSFLPEDFRKAREKEYISRAQAQGGDLDENPDLLSFWDGILNNIRQRNDPEAALAYIDNFNKTYGKWLLQKNSVIKINDIIFVHGGINLQYSSWKIKEINEVVRLELGAYALHPTNPRLGGQPLMPRLVYNPQSPLWYRQDDITSQTEIDKILANLGATRMVVGHNFLGSGGGSPIVLQEDAVARFENKIWMIDTGIGYSDVGGILYALLIEDGMFDFYAGSADPARQSSEEQPTSEGLETPDEIEDYLRISTPQVVIPGAAGRTEPWRVRLESDGITRWAQFKYINRPRPEPIPDSFRYEIAAYELDKYLGLGFVPPTVERTIKDTLGSLQMFVENAVRESDRKREESVLGDKETHDQRMEDLKVFENLVYDSCENEKDTLIQKDTGKIFRVDFSEAFAPENGTVPGCEILRCSRRLYQRLSDWDQERVTSLLTAYLNEEEIRALQARRGSIVRMIQKEIEIRGERAVLF
jgi:hypothetical protein